MNADINNNNNQVESNSNTGSVDPSSGQKPKQIIKQRHSFCRLKCFFKWLFAPIWYPVVWFYCLGAIEKFTAVLCVIGIIQCWAFMESERASLTVTGFGIEGGLVANTPISLVIVTKNSGKSSGTINNFYMNASGTLPTPDEYHASDVNLTVAPLPPGDMRFSSFKPTVTTTEGKQEPFYFTEPELQKIANKEIGFYVYGYMDVGDDYSVLLGYKRVKFCYVYLPDGSTPERTRVGVCPYQHPKKNKNSHQS